MTKEEIRARYSRIPTDFSQIEMLKNQLLEAGLIDVAQINPENAGKALVFDENGALTVGEAAGGGVTIEGSSLVIPEQERPTPEPIINIDGVDYYNKCEFDVESMLTDQTEVWLNVLTGEQMSSNTYPCIRYTGSFGPGVKSIIMNTYSGSDMSNVLLCADNQYRITASYASHAFTIVDTPSKVINNNTIYLPDCSAYYGWLSDDKKTFISYFNLKDVPSKIDSVKQGTATIPFAVHSGNATQGAALTADGVGGTTWSIISAGTKLYKHYLMYSYTVQGDESEYSTYMTLFSAQNTRIVDAPSLFSAMSNAIAYCGETRMTFLQLNYPGDTNLQCVKLLSDGTTVSEIRVLTGFNDTVTEL